MSSLLVSNEVTRINTLGLVSSLRGIHSTGVATAYRPATGETTAKYMYWADAINSATFLESEPYKSMTTDTGLQLVLGHCRHATLGAVNKANAHPFYVEPVLGCHNGTMQSFAPPHNLRDTETDSLRFYRKLAETVTKGGTFKDVRDEHMKDSDAYALTWIDTTDNTLHITRNEARTLYMMLTTHITSNAGTMYYASEPCFLKLMDSRSTISHQAPVFFKPHKEYVFDIGDVSSMRVEDIPIKPKVYQVKTEWKGALADKSDPVVLKKAEATDADIIPFQRTEHSTGSGSTKKTYVVNKDGVVVEKGGDPDALVSSTGIETHPATKFHDESISEHRVLPRVYTKKGVEYLLRYRGFGGKLYGVKDIKKILSNNKSLVSHKQGNVNESLIWLDEDCYVKPDEVGDLFIQQTFNQRFRGELVYVNKRQYAAQVAKT